MRLHPLLPVLLLAACSRPRLADGDLAKLNQALGVVESAEAGARLQMLMSGLSDLDLHRSAACKRELTTYVEDNNPAERANAGARVPDDCRFACRFDTASAQLPSQKQLAAIVARCPKPDPIEAAAGPLRDRLAPGEYVILRGLVEEADAALAADGAADAKTAHERLAASVRKAIEGETTQAPAPSHE